MLFFKHGESKYCALMGSTLRIFMCSSVRITAYFPYVTSSICVFNVSNANLPFFPKQKLALKCHYICPLECYRGNISSHRRPQSLTYKEHVQKIYQSLLHPSRTDGFYHHSPNGLWSSAGAGPWALSRGMANTASQWKLISWSPPKLPGRFRLYEHSPSGLRIHHRDEFRKISWASWLSFLPFWKSSLFARHCAKMSKIQNHKLL